ncbi:hypothetical protein IFM89_009435 [Coptis chinensis]|uniref:DUF4283 domain-containing protein n=1 Tax=Coptis chinensis TaxID=261450 RepID=A0A835IB69_9MAGN|nr:hypothetical protein IFM89_009435 [Coptis chinensis]
MNTIGNQSSNWSSLFQRGNVSITDTSLQRFELEMIEGVTQVPMDLRWKGLNEWREYVVGFFLEQRLLYPVVKEFLKKKWKTKGVYEMVADSDLFYFKFSNEEDKRKVLENPQIFMAGKCFIVTQWTQDIERRKDDIKAIPIWLNLYNVPKVLWTGEGLGFLASRIGEPQRMDEATTLRKRLLYARVCVLVEITVELPDSFEINMGVEDVRKISVEYGWVPKKCDYCKRFGHKTNDCSSIGNIHRVDTRVETRVHTTEIPSVTSSIRNNSGAENTEHNEVPVTTSQTEIDREERGVHIVECATEGTMNDMNLRTGGLNVAGVDLNSRENTMGEDNETRVDEREETMINEEDLTVGQEEMNTIIEMVENEVMAIVLATTAEVPEKSAKMQENESDSESDVCQSNMFAALVPFENTQTDEMQTNPDPLMHYEVEQNEYNNLLVATRNGDLSDEESSEEETIYFKDMNTIPLEGAIDQWRLE